MTRIKVCGITTLDDALLCAREGVDLLGLNFYPPSPRSIAPEAARVLTGALRAELGAACPLLLGVFVNEDPGAIIQIIDFVGLDGAQLSGDESAESLAALQGRAVKAIRPRSAAEAAEHAARYLPHAPADDRLPAVLVDAYHKALYGGTGEQASLVEYPTAAPKKNLFGAQPDPEPTPVTVTFPTMGEQTYERVDVAKLALEHPTTESLITVPEPSESPQELTPDRNVNGIRMVLILAIALVVVLGVVFLL